MTRLTREQAAVLGAFTGVLCGPFDDIHAYAERKFGEPIFSHMFASKKLADELKELAREDFYALCAEGCVTSDGREL